MLYTATLTSEEARHMAMLYGGILIDLIKRTNGNKPSLQRSGQLDDVRRCILLSAMAPLIVIDEHWPDNEAKKTRFYEIVYAIWILYGLDGTTGGEGADRIVRHSTLVFSLRILTNCCSLVY